MYCRVSLILLLGLFVLSAQAQTGNLRCKWIPSVDSSFILDTVTVLPFSIQITEPDDPDITLDYDAGTRQVVLSAPGYDSVKVCYRVLNFDLSQRYFKRDIADYDSSSVYREVLGEKQFNPYFTQRDELFASPGLSKSGSVSRGMSFGNNQNVFVNSNLNLQMEGRLTDDIDLTAVINDQNIPFQPEGNTQQLQEFDKVYIQLKSPTAGLIAGDLVLQNRTPSYFLKFNRNVQGGQVEYNHTVDSSNYSSTRVGAAVSKGKFNSVFLDVLEGVQGPYRLRGANNERFVTILANSEKVYLDGKLLKRGFDYDYVIDYNQAEITFTSNVLITRFSVVRIDFEYTDRNYGRVNAAGSHYQHIGRADVFVNYYIERDNPNNPLLFDPGDDDLDALSLAGDDLMSAVVSGVDSTGYNAERIMYKAKDSLGQVIYERSADPELAIYQVSFSDVGPGNGSYAPAFSTANGRVYEFVGMGNGSFAPLRVVPTPKKKEMFSVGGSYQFSKNISAFSEVAVSRNDQNLYSSVHDDDNTGYALKSGVAIDRQRFLLKGYTWHASLDFEFDNENFRPIDRFRDVNFDRDWSAAQDTFSTDRILNFNAGFAKDPQNLFAYKFSWRDKAGQVQGFQQSYNLSQTIGQFITSSDGFWMKNDQGNKLSDWKRFRVSNILRGGLFQPGVSYQMDKNVITEAGGRVTGTAMYYDEIKLFLNSGDSTNSDFFLEYSYREDKDSLAGNLHHATSAQTVSGGFHSFLNMFNEVNTLFTYRKLDYNNIMFPDLQDENTIQGRVDWNADLFNRHVRSELTVTTGTGRELKREFIYIPFQPGQGTHRWIDANENGTKELDEFQEVNPDVATNDTLYVKTFVPTDEYVKAYTGSVNYRLDVTAPRKWKSSDILLKRFVSRLSSVSSWTVDKKLLESDFLERFSPVFDNVENNEVLSASRALRATAFYNRSNPVYGLDFTVVSSENKVLMTQGFETREKESYRLSSRLNIRQNYNARLIAEKESTTNRSDFLTRKNYSIVSYNAGPEFSWQPRTNLRFSLKGNYEVKSNQLKEGGEVAELLEAALNIRWNKLGRRTIESEFRFVHIDAQLGETSLNTPLAYEMLEALSPGHNITWNINWSEKLTNGLQLNFIYEGRKSEESRAVHVGRMQASVLF